MVHRMLRNPVYAGVLRYGDYPEVKGTWEPLVSMEKWKVLQDVLDDKTKPIFRRRDHAFKGVMKCDRCGLSITAYTKIKPNGKEYTYYSCTKRKGNCGNPPVTENYLNEYFYEKCRMIRISPERLAQLKNYTFQYLEDSFKSEVEQRADIEKQINLALDKQNKLLELRLSEELSKEEYLSKKEEINQEVMRLEELRKDSTYSRKEIRDRLELLFEKLGSIDKAFEEGSIQQKREIILEIGENITLNNKEVRWNFQKPWDSMVEVVSAPKTINWGDWRDSNPRPSVPQTDALTS